MKCYNHRESDAVAICKSCQRALCMDCSVDVTNGIACKDKCEEEVIAINVLYARGKSAYNKASKTYIGMAIIFGLMAIIMIAIGVFTYLSAKEGESTFFPFFIIPTGIVFLIGAGIYMRAASKIKSIKEGGSMAIQGIVTTPTFASARAAGSRLFLQP